MRIEDAPARRNGPEDRPQSALGRSILALALAAMLGQGARANPLTEVPGARPALPAPGDPAPERAEAQARNPDATVLIRALAPFADGNPGAPAQTLAPDDGGPALRVVAARSVDLTVFFAYDSAWLTPEARIQLEPLGQALGAPDLVGHGFLIAGHTDAAGAPLHNRRLALARARAVKAHLVATYGIAPERLRVHGWGPSRLKDPAAPLSRVNRRVEVSLIAPARMGALRFVLPVAETACETPLLADPRLRIALDLDDFGAAPTPPACRP